ncbi:MAG: glucokinase, partial [Anaerolineae bacterium]|nr:glucokinase [Anaerolineae bacterium]
MIIAADVGGTKTLLGLYDAAQGRRPLVTRTYRSAGFAHLEDIVEAFRHDTNHPTITNAVFGIPGPVFQGEVHATNLPWVIRVQDLHDATGIPNLTLLNDLEAAAYGVPFLDGDDLLQLNEVPVQPGNKVIIAPGTGLGEAILIYSEGRYHAVATEGGHVDFAPRNLFEIELLRYLLGKFGHVSYERVCSGIGIPHIYDYLSANNFAPEKPEIAEKLANSADRTPVIVEAALNYRSDLCQETLNVFVSILGAEAGNMALKVLARGACIWAGASHRALWRSS